MKLDYEALAAKDNPFEGLATSQKDWMIVYLAFVREPVMTLDDIETRWHVHLGPDMPLFEAVQAADRIRYAIRCRKERPSQIKMALLALGCAALLLLCTIELVRMPRMDQIRHFESETANAREKAEIANQEAVKCKADAQACIQSAEKDAQDRIQSAENGARTWLNERIAGYVCAAQSGTLENADALDKIKEQIQVLSKPVAVHVSGELSEIVKRANLALAQTGKSWSTLFDSAEQLKNYLVKNPGMQEAQKLDLSDLMMNCYRRALDHGYGKAGFELFLLYNGVSLCIGRARYRANNQTGDSKNNLVVASNWTLAESSLSKGCELGDYEALSVMLYLAEDRRKMDYRKCLMMLGEHANATPEQLYRIATVFLRWSRTDDYSECGCKESGSYYSRSHDKKRHQEHETKAIEYFRQASARGDVASKRWLIDRGYPLN